MDRFYECNVPKVIYERFDDETVLINLDTGRYYSLDAPGMVVWELLNQPLGLEAVVQSLEQAYEADPEQVRRAVAQFIEQLEAEALIRQRAAPPIDARPAVAVEIAAGAQFQSPVLATYNDMADILMLDPIHDVDERGWPHASNAAEPAEPRIEDDDVSTWPSLDEVK